MPAPGEQLEWLAEEIIEAHGSATVWLAHPTSASSERELATSMAAARAAEYAKVIAEATAALRLDDDVRATTARRLRAELRRIQRRDYFPPAERDQAHETVSALTTPHAADLEEHVP